MSDVNTPGAHQSDGARGGSLVSLFSQHRLSPSHQKIAQAILDNPVEALFLSGSLLANRAGVSQPSVTRFAQALGYHGLDDMFVDFRRRVLQDDLGAEDKNRYQELVAQEAQNLNAVYRGFGETVRMRFLAEHLASQPVIPVYGTGKGRPVSQYFYDSCRTFHSNVIYVDGPNRDRVEQLISAKEQGGRWFVAFLFKPFFPENVETLEQARDLGLSVGLVTDHRYKYTESIAEFTAVAAVGGRFTFPPMVSPFVLTATLLELMLEELGPAAKRRMAAVDERVSAAGYQVSLSQLVPRS